MSKSKKGYVYVLTNPAMPGYVKIGRSIYGGQKRASQLYQTGVPAPFVLDFEMLFDDAYAAEAMVHEAVSFSRSNCDREFFAVTADAARAAVVLAWMTMNELCHRTEEDSENLAILRVIEEDAGMCALDVSAVIRTLGRHILAESLEKVKARRSCNVLLSSLANREA